MADNNLSNRIMEHIKVLAEQIGPRGPTSENEKRASEYIHSVMEKNGLLVKTERFLSPSTFTWYYAIPCSIIFLSFLIFPFHRLSAFVVSTLGALFFMAEINTIETISLLFPKKESQNVIARIKPKKAADKRIIIVTHHDTSKPSISFNPRFVKYFRASIILMIFSVVFVPIIYGLITIFSWNEIFFYISIPFSFYLFTSVMILVHRELVYKPIHGANDNASGAGILIRLSEALSNAKFENTEIWFLSTGCEEVGAIGMIRFLKKYGRELNDAYFICIDNVGKGQIRYTTAEGLIKAFKSSKTLVETAQRSSLNRNIDAKEFVCKIYPTNALPCLVRKYKVISILATDENGLIYNWHWDTDTMENLDVETINMAYDLVSEMVRLIDAEVV